MLLTPKVNCATATAGTMAKMKLMGKNKIDIRKLLSQFVSNESPWIADVMAKNRYPAAVCRIATAVHEAAINKAETSTTAGKLCRNSLQAFLMSSVCETAIGPRRG